MSGLGDALSYVASSIDKPGRAVRGVLGGKPREALAALPFSDTMGLTDPNDRVSGRNLTDAIGLTRSGDQGWGSWGVGHLAEMATDPVQMLPLGHLASTMAKAGKFEGLGSALAKFGAEESGAAKLGYGLSRSPKAAMAERQAFKAPVGHGIETPASEAYRLKPGPAPVARPLQPMPHELPAIAEAPKYADADEMLRSYYARQQPEAIAPGIEPYVPAPSEGDMRFLGDFHNAARQGAALGEMGSLGEAIKSPAINRLFRRFFPAGNGGFGG